MALTSQDIVNRLDFTGLTSISGSQLNQSVATAKAASDKGLIIETTDSAPDVPIVPDPSVILEGILPDFWIRYRWKRVAYSADLPVKNYVWNQQLSTSDATFLKWVWEGQEAADALANSVVAINTANSAQTTATNALTAATTAQNTANTAQTTANTANTNANTANATANTAATTANTAQTAVNGLTTTVTGLSNNLTTLTNKLARVPLGSFYIKDIKTIGTDGGTFTAGSWVERDLNDMVLDNDNLVGYCLLASNIFTLVAGRWSIEAEAPAFGVDEHQARLRNSDTDADIGFLVGSSSASLIADGKATTCSRIIGTFDLAATTNIHITHKCITTKATNGFGVAAGLDREVYTQVKLTYLGSI